MGIGREEKLSDKNITPQPGPAPDCEEMRKEKKHTPLTMKEMSRMHIGAGRVQPPVGAEQNAPKTSQEADWLMKAGEKIRKGLAAVGKGISNAMDAAGSAVESAENFLNDCACEVSSWDWGFFNPLLDGARGYSGEGGWFTRNKFWGAVTKGTHNFTFGTVKGIINLVGHPLQTAKGIGHAVTHPKELLNGLKEHYWGSNTNWTQKVSGVTEAVCDVAFLLYGAKKGFDKLSKGSKAGEAGKVTESVAKAGEAAEDVAKAGEVAEEAAKAGEVAEEAAKAGEVAEDAAKAGEVAEEAAKAGEVAEDAAKAGETAGGKGKVKIESGDAIVELSKNNIEHVLKNHTFGRMKKTIERLMEKGLKGSAEKLVKKKTFFNPKWSEKEVVEAVNRVYNEAVSKGITEGDYTSIVSGEKITVYFEDGGFHTAYGVYKFSLSDFGY